MSSGQLGVTSEDNGHRRSSVTVMRRVSVIMLVSGVWGLLLLPPYKVDKKARFCTHPIATSCLL